MKWVWLSLIISMPVLAQEKCLALKNSIITIENKFQASTLQKCRDLKPQDLGLTLPDELRAEFEKARCASMGNIDTKVGDTEAQLVLMDELNDLREQALKTKRTLESAPSWNESQKVLATQFMKDVTLAATAQAVIDSDKLKNIFNDDTKGPAWENKLNTFCQGSTPNSASTICSQWKSYGPESTNKALPTSDFFSFLDELRALTDNGSLPETKKKDLLSMLELDDNGKKSDFLIYQDATNEFGLFNAMTDANITKLSKEQIQLLRAFQLRLPNEKDNVSSIQKLISRLSKSQDKLLLKTSSEMFKDLNNDSNARFEARLKSRWTALQGSISSSDAPICLEPNVDLTSCIRNAWTSLKSRYGNNITEQQNQYFNSLLSSSERLASNKKATITCNKDSVLQALIKSLPVPDECNLDKMPKKTDVELKRKMLLALRERLATQEDKRLRFRKFATDEFKNSCNVQGRNQSFESAPRCNALPGTVEFAPALQLMADTIPVFLEGLTPKAELSTADCPDTLEGEYASICRILKEPATDSYVTYTPANVSPTTLDTDAPTRQHDPVIGDALAGVASGIANMWAQNKMNNMYRPSTPWQMAPYQAFPYSRPISLSMSDYVMATSTNYGGYGNYYQCSTCGFGTNQSAFNSYWGTGSSLSSPVTGMGGAGLGGTSLSGQVFSGGFAKF